MPHADTAATNAPLAGISRTVAEGAHPVGRLARNGGAAATHRARQCRLAWCKGLDANAKVTLLPRSQGKRSYRRFPDPSTPDGPDPSPIGKVWVKTRPDRLAISVFETYPERVARCCGPWNSCANYNNTGRSITRRSEAESG